MKEKLIHYDNITTGGKALHDYLVKIWDNEEFILGILSMRPEEDDRWKLLQYIKKHPEINDEDITLYAVRECRGLPHPDDEESYYGQRDF